jgi:tetratricopeptide (TPR) repeat protein
VADALGIALRLAPLAQDAIEAVIGKNAVGKLIRLVESDVRGSHVVPLGWRERVADVWSSQRVDSELVGRLTAWLATGHEEHLAGAGARWRELLGGVVDAVEVDLEEVVSATVHSARRHLAEAQRSDRDAVHVESESVRDAVRRAAVDVKEHLTSELARNARQEAAVPPRRFNMPVVAASFAGREAQLADLHEALARADRAIVTQTISGLGGVGKSQLAAHYVNAHADEYQLVAWIGAEDGGVVDFANLAVALGLVVDGLAPSDRAQLAREWLAGSDRRWLLVLDNVTSADQLARLHPASGNGQVLVTSRDRSLDQFGPLLTVDVFDEDTAIGYLIERAGRPHDTDGARQVARALGCLPLALSHAASFCQHGTSFGAYLELLDELPARELFSERSETAYAQTVASTWKTSIQAATQRAQLAGELLELAAHLAPDAIPKLLFTVLVNGENAPARLRLTAAFNALARFSLATVHDCTMDVHRLLQKVVRNDATQRGDHTAGLRALDALRAAFPKDVSAPERWPFCERLLPHALALADTLRDPGDNATQLIEVLDRACRYLIWAERGQRTLAASQLALDRAERVLGAEHPDTLTIHHILAYAYRAAGRTAEAIAIFRSLLVTRERVLGAEHSDTLETRYNLATAYQDMGRTGEAIAIDEPLLATQERLLGAEHPNTLSTHHGLARAYQAAGRIREAIAIFEPLLATRERVLGAEHPDTLGTRHGLARAYQAAGRIREAIAIFEPLLATRERVLGAQHRNTLKTHNSLAGAYQAAGRISEAIAIYEPLLATQERVLGTQHPDTLWTRNNFARAYTNAGRISEAIAIYEPLLATQERVLGTEHPNTLSTRDQLAAAYRAAGRTTDASVIARAGA